MSLYDRLKAHISIPSAVTILGVYEFVRGCSGSPFWELHTSLSFCSMASLFVLGSYW